MTVFSAYLAATRRVITRAATGEVMIVPARRGPSALPVMNFPTSMDECGSSHGVNEHALNLHPSKEAVVAGERGRRASLHLSSTGAGSRGTSEVRARGPLALK